MNSDNGQPADDDRFQGLDRAQLMKLGAAALLAAIAGGATEEEADAAVHTMTRSNIVPIGLDFQTRNFGKHAIMQKTRMGKELRRVRITSDKSKTAGATIVHKLDDAEIIGNDETGHKHNRQFGTAPMYVALWVE